MFLAVLLLLTACGDVTEGSGRLAGGPTSTTAATTTTNVTPSETTITTAPTTTTTAAPPTSTTAPTTTTTVAGPRPDGDADSPALLERGDEGPDVEQLQRQLRGLRFWVGPVDGVFGWLTEQAVYALQKANGVDADGRVGPRTRAVLAEPDVPAPQTSRGRAIEIDRSRQLLYVVNDGELQWVFQTSTGTEQPYRHPDGHTAVADTPPGRHTVDWQVDGWREGTLGPLYRPKYFQADGIAVHGYGVVPPYPASHGCVRVTFDAMDFICAEGLMPLGSVVLVYGHAPPPGPAV